LNYSPVLKRIFIRNKSNQNKITSNVVYQKFMNEDTETELWRRPHDQVLRPLETVNEELKPLSATMGAAILEVNSSKVGKP
jgi:hypothetical protein